MPRQARRKSERGIYHVMLRGINRQQIFEDEEDYRKLINVLKDCKEVSGFDLYAYCLMGNHVHLLIKPGAEGLEQIFKRIGGRYVYWYNRKYSRTGHLFQDRFKSEPVDTEEYFLTVLRYIHYNPVKAGLCQSIYDYKYSSIDAYSANNSTFVDVEFAFGISGKDALLKFFNIEADSQCMDIEAASARLGDKEAIAIICKTANTQNPQEIQTYRPEDRNRILSELRKCGLSIRQISRLTGVSFNVVRKY